MRPFEVNGKPGDIIKSNKSYINPWCLIHLSRNVQTGIRVGQINSFAFQLFSSLKLCTSGPSRIKTGPAAKTVQSAEIGRLVHSKDVKVEDIEE